MIHQSFLLAKLPDRQPATLLLPHPLPPRTLQSQISTHDSLLKLSKVDRSRLSWAARWRSPDGYVASTEGNPGYTEARDLGH